MSMMVWLLAGSTVCPCMHACMFVCAVVHDGRFANRECNSGEYNLHIESVCK